LSDLSEAIDASIHATCPGVVTEWLVIGCIVSIADDGSQNDTLFVIEPDDGIPSHHGLGLAQGVAARYAREIADDDAGWLT
jgi:hypothetical protein